MATPLDKARKELERRINSIQEDRDALADLQHELHTYIDSLDSSLESLHEAAAYMDNAIDEISKYA